MFSLELGAELKQVEHGQQKESEQFVHSQGDTNGGSRRNSMPVDGLNHEGKAADSENRNGCNLGLEPLYALEHGFNIHVHCPEECGENAPPHHPAHVANHFVVQIQLVFTQAHQIFYKKARQNHYYDEKEPHHKNALAQFKVDLRPLPPAEGLGSDDAEGIGYPVLYAGEAEGHIGVEEGGGAEQIEVSGLRENELRDERVDAEISVG